MDGNSIVAKLLAENVHADTSALGEDVVSDLGKLPEKSSSLPVEDFGIWIDPIGEIVLLELDQFEEFNFNFQEMIICTYLPLILSK